MQVEKINPTVSYTSRNYPIKPFKIKTDKGVLTCKEIDYDKEYGNSFYRNIGEFFLDNFANTSSHPFWKKCRKPTLNLEIYRDYIRDNVIEYRGMVKNPDTTFLLGRNEWGKIKAAIYTRPLEIGKAKEPETLYIDSLAVNKRYRGHHIGKKFMTKVINSSKDRFKDSFLVAYNESVPFYKKLGYKITEDAPEDSRTLAKVALERIDYPEYAQFMEKTLSKNPSKKWYQRADEQS